MHVKINPSFFKLVFICDVQGILVVLDSVEWIMCGSADISIHTVPRSDTIASFWKPFSNVLSPKWRISGNVTWTVYTLYMYMWVRWGFLFKFSILSKTFVSRPILVALILFYDHCCNYSILLIDNSPKRKNTVSAFIFSTHVSWKRQKII